MRAPLIALILALTACTPKPPVPEIVPAAETPPPPAPDPAHLLGAWIVTGAGDTPIEASTAESNPGTQSWFRITKDRIQGNLYCNGFGATYSAQFDTFDAEPPLQTEMGCGNNGNAIESAIATAIDKASGWTIAADGTLALRDGGNTLLSARRPGPDETEYALFGLWKVTALDGAPVARPEGDEVTIAFQRDTIGGTSFCNGWGGGYSVDGNRLSISEPVSTAIGCDGDPELFAALSTGATLDFSDPGALVIANNGHSILAEPF